MVNVSYDDNVVNLSYIIIVPFCAYTFMLKCFFESMKEITFDDSGSKCVSLRNNI